MTPVFAQNDPHRQTFRTEASAIGATVPVLVDSAMAALDANDPQTAQRVLVEPWGVVKDTK